MTKDLDAPFISSYPDVDLYCLRGTKETLERHLERLQKKQAEHWEQSLRDTWLDEKVLEIQRIIIYSDIKIAAVEEHIKTTDYPSLENEE